MVELLKESGFSDKAIDYYTRKVNVGILSNPSISFSYTGHCGDTMIIYLQIDSNIIIDAKFGVIGCAGAFSAGSALIEIIKGKNILTAKNITEEDIIEHLGGVPSTKIDCVYLARKAFEQTLELFKEKKSP